YEPVWAIGVAAAAADPRHAGAVHRGIPDLLRTQDGGGVALRVVYGGSVDRDSATPLLEQDGVDGLFVGRAALDPRHFAAIAAQAEELAGPR
ncbi:MAG: triose-phosphate isomerase, partial [Candidatus Dormibacteraceae bacterium]